MKKVIITSAIALAFTTVTAHASEPVYRIGGGLSFMSADVTVNSESWLKPLDFITSGNASFDTGFKIEAGVDLNDYIGFALSYDQNKGAKFKGFKDNQGLFDNNTLTFTTDLGHKFYLGNGFTVKPYFSLGSQLHSYDLGEQYFDITAGFGARATYKHVYADFSVNKALFDGSAYGYTNNAYVRGNAQTGVSYLTIGYVF